MKSADTARTIVSDWLREVGDDSHGIEWDDLADLRGRISIALSGRWVPVAERLPSMEVPRKPYAGFWVYRPGSEAGTMWETEHPSWWNVNLAPGACPISHWLDWQPPEPPK
jgi:hypothetical protein